MRAGGHPSEGARLKKSGSGERKSRGLSALMRRAIGHDAIRFLAAGSFASAVNWLARFPLSALMPFEAAVALAFLIGMSVGFGLYRAWVFPGSSLPLNAQIRRFLTVNAAAAVAVLLGSMVLLRLFLLVGLTSTAAEALAHALAIGFGAIVNYFGHRALTFAKRGSGYSHE
jgi:energy-coupling factor transport system substrate-specific component